MRHAGLEQENETVENEHLKKNLPRHGCQIRGKQTKALTEAGCWSGLNYTLAGAWYAMLCNSLTLWIWERHGTFGSSRSQKISGAALHQHGEPGNACRRKDKPGGHLTAWQCMKSELDILNIIFSRYSLPRQRGKLRRASEGLSIPAMEQCGLGLSSLLHQSNAGARHQTGRRLDWVQVESTKGWSTLLTCVVTRQPFLTLRLVKTLPACLTESWLWERCLNMEKDWRKIEGRVRIGILCPLCSLITPTAKLLTSVSCPAVLGQIINHNTIMNHHQTIYWCCNWGLITAIQAMMLKPFPCVSCHLYRVCWHIKL